VTVLVTFWQYSKFNQFNVHNNLCSENIATALVMWSHLTHVDA